MKRLLTLILLVFTCFSGVAEEKALQYLFPEFQNGQVIFKDGRNFIVSLNFSLISNRFVFIDTHDDNIIKEFAQPEEIGIVKVGERIFQLNSKGEAMEVVRMENPRVLAQYKGKVTDRGKKSAYGGRSQTSAIESISSFQSGGISYKIEGDDRWIVTGIDKKYQVERDKKMKNFTTAKQFIKLYPKQHATAIEDYINTNHTDFDSVEQVIALCIYADSLK